jgi:hypothetical protein
LIFINPRAYSGIQFRWGKLAFNLDLFALAYWLCPALIDNVHPLLSLDTSQRCRIAISS